MGDERGGGPEAPVDLDERVENRDAGLAVKRARGLVSEQDLGPLGDGAGDRDALLLASRKLGGEMV